jgi:tetratricopeptide (TPR) repeat protein
LQELVSTTHPYHGEEREMTTATRRSREKPSVRGRASAAATGKPGATPRPGGIRQEAQAIDLAPARKAELAKQSADLITRVGELYRQGRYAEALAPAEQALTLRQQLYPAARYPDGHPALAQSLSWLGLLLRAPGDYPKAQLYHERALAIYGQLYPAARYPDGHPDLAQSLNNLG